MTQSIMSTRYARSLALLALGAGLLSYALALHIQADDTKTAPLDKPNFTPEQIATYEKDVLPLLQKNCLKCHGAEEKVKGEFNLSTRKAILNGGASGAVVDLKNPEQS
jgi:mono/diheme cytochrome c family protein